jgi:hypothetical protein
MQDYSRGYDRPCKRASPGLINAGNDTISMPPQFPLVKKRIEPWRGNFPAKKVQIAA